MAAPAAMGSDPQLLAEIQKLFKSLGDANGSGLVKQAALAGYLQEHSLPFARAQISGWLQRSGVAPEAPVSEQQVLQALEFAQQGDKQRMPVRPALVIVDVQNDFCPPSGSLAVADGEKIIPTVNWLRTAVGWASVALSLDWHPENHVSFLANHADDPEAKLFQPHRLPNGQLQVMWPAHCVQNSDGAKLHPALHTKPEDLIVLKGKDPNVDSYSAFYDNDHKTKSDLEDLLLEHHITDVFVTGLAYDYCVGSTALDARAAGFRVWVVEDCSRGVAPETTELMRARLRLGGVNIVHSQDIPGIVKQLLSALPAEQQKEQLQQQQ